MFSEKQLSSLLTTLPDPAFVLTRSGRYVAIFGGMDARYYHDGSSLVGKYIHEVLTTKMSNWFICEIEKALTSHTLHIIEYSLARSDIQGLTTDGPDDIIWFEGRVQELDFLIEGEHAVLWVASNITHRKELETQLRKQSEIDLLTNMYTRRKLLDVLATQFDTFSRYQTPISLLMFDVDEFKFINDTYGHLKGDLALQTIATICHDEMRNTDYAGRLGGDEIAILMPHTTCENAAQLIERIRVRIAVEMRALGVIRGGTISGGISVILAEDTSFKEVLQRADHALYQAKHAGRNCVITYATAESQASIN